MLLTYSLTKAKCALCDVAQFAADLLTASRVHNILTIVMTRIVVDKSTDHAKPHLICFFFTTISKLTKLTFVLTTENTDLDLKVHALHYGNELFVSVRFSFQKHLKTRLICRNNTIFML